MSAFKICIIGAGSVGFTKKLCSDILKVPEFEDIEIALTDISDHNLDMIRQIIERIVEVNGLKTRVTATTDRRAALEGARYVMNCVRIGGLEAFESDISIPLKYGIDQCVGDTICAGGIMYGQRGIAAILEFCKDIREVAEEGAWLLNYANPMAMMTWAALEYGGVKTVGLCHGVQNGHRQIAEAIGAEKPDDVEIICSGINHQTWYLDIRHKGRVISKSELVSALEAHPVFSRQEKVRIDVLKRFGFYSTESNGHLSEYLPWYRKRPDEIQNWISMDDWIHGETGGYLRYCTENRTWFKEDFPRFLEEAATPLQGPRTDEHASWIIEALETGRAYRGHFNVRNGGTIRNLPEDAIIESTGYVDRFGINMIEGIELPLACAATCTTSINVQRMSVKAAMTGDAELLKQAMLHDPLVGAICTPEEVWQMVDELLVAQADWLPQYKDAIPAAKDRLSQSKVTTRTWMGAARKDVRSVDELRSAKDEPNVNPGHGLGTELMS